MFNRLLAVESLLENTTICPKKSEDVQSNIIYLAVEEM
jgi:hypothetical protein